MWRWALSPALRRGRPVCPKFSSVQKTPNSSTSADRARGVQSRWVWDVGCQLLGGFVEPGGCLRGPGLSPLPCTAQGCCREPSCAQGGVKESWGSCGGGGAPLHTLAPPSLPFPLQLIQFPDGRKLGPSQCTDLHWSNLGPSPEPLGAPLQPSQAGWSGRIWGRNTPSVAQIALTWPLLLARTAEKLGLLLLHPHFQTHPQSRSSSGRQGERGGSGEAAVNPPTHPHTPRGC